MRPYLRVANVFEDRIDTTDLKEMDFSGVFERFKLQPGDVLLNEGQTPELLGRPAIYRGIPENIAFTNTLIRFQVGPDVTPDWALAVFRHHMHSGRFTRESRITTNIAHLSATRFKTVEFPVPPLAEQRRIVDILEDHISRLDAGRLYLKSARRRLVALRRAVLDEHFGITGPQALLGDLITEIEAGRSFGGATGGAAENDWGIIKVSAMTWGEFRPEENKAVPPVQVDPRYEIHEGDLLVSRANTSEYVGASMLVGHVRRRLLLSDKSLRLKLRPGVRPDWLWRALQSPSARRQMTALATGTKDSMRNISQKSLLQVRLPDHAGDVQEAAVDQFQRVDDALRVLDMQLTALEKRADGLSRALLAAAFSGKLTGRNTDQEVVEELVDE